MNNLSAGFVIWRRKEAMAGQGRRRHMSSLSAAGQAQKGANDQIFTPQAKLAVFCRSETCFGKPARKLFREARRASPQRQNNGARACDGAGLPWLSRKLRPSPGKLFREARRASSQRQNYGSERERRAPSEAVAKASAVAQKVFLGSPTGLTPASKQRERAFGQPDGPDPIASRKMARDAPGPGFCEP